MEGTEAIEKNKVSTDRPLPANPFTDAYWQRELKWLGLKKSAFHVEHVAVDWFKIQGRCDDYLNANMRFCDVWMPRLSINGHLWMSLTPMEIQSHALAIHRATGNVATVGLGLGYYALRVANKPEVTAVTVFEREKPVIEWFNRVHKDRPERAKITIVEGDARQIFKGYTFDFVYADLYQDLLGDEVLADAKLFRRRNKIGRYHFWGMERALLEILLHKLLKFGTLQMGRDLIHYYQQWKSTPFDENSDTTLGEMHHPQLDKTFLRAVVKSLRDYPI